MKAKAIIVRELFVSGKTIKTYLLRLVPPVLVLGILGAFALGDDFTEMVKDGRFLFTVTLIVSLLYTILAGFFVSSCISHEREEDTIGLLFLTPLKGMDTSAFSAFFYLQSALAFSSPVSVPMKEFPVLSLLYF